jgi:phage host-nuclease inhibitor protein Gam
MRQLKGKFAFPPSNAQPLRIDCWDEADAALAELGRLRERLERLEERRADALARVQANAVEAERAWAARQRRLEAALERFCRRHQPELARVNGHSRRSRRLLFGRVGYRRSQSVVVRSEAAALRALAQWRAGQRFLRLRTELDRDALGRFLRDGARARGDAAFVRRRLGRAGIRLDTRDLWFYELDRRALERWGS